MFTRPTLRIIAGTPASLQYEFVSAFVSRGFDLISITDHNTGTYVDRAIAARHEIATKEGKNITILPGVELYVSPGVHLLAILPEGGSAAISDLLSRLGLSVEQHGDTSALISQSIEDIARIVHQRRGLLIGAHCNSTHGIVEELDGQPRLEWIRSVDALEINSESADDSIHRTVDYVTNELGVSIPFTFGSDSHNSAHANEGMWVKMAQPSFASLLQLTFEPELRIRRIEPALPTHGRIVGFTTTHGIYGGERFRFSTSFECASWGAWSREVSRHRPLEICLRSRTPVPTVASTSFLQIGSRAFCNWSARFL